jgi:iron-sulfur cluster assembly protein
MEFADAPEAKDRIFEQHGVAVYIDPKSLLYLKGTLLDFSSSVQSSGFKWNNPNQKKSCGCGESFSV